MPICETHLVSPVKRIQLQRFLGQLETAHAVAETMRIAAKRDQRDVVVLCFSGRGDNDCAEVARLTAQK